MIYKVNTNQLFYFLFQDSNHYEINPVMAWYKHLLMYHYLVLQIFIKTLEKKNKAYKCVLFILIMNYNTQQS